MKTAIFLIGGPGSGKDIIIKESLSRYSFNEYDINQLKNINGFDSDIIITANAYNYDIIAAVKNKLDESFSCYCVYVDVNNDASKQRLAARNLDEALRIQRLLDSKMNIGLFEDLFGSIIYFNNSYTRNSIKIREQLEEINNKFDGLFETVYLKFKTDKETKKIKKINPAVFMRGLVQKNELGPTFDTRQTGDSALIQTFQYKTESYDNVDDFMNESMMSPDFTDSSVALGANSPVVNQDISDKPLHGYEVKSEKKKLIKRIKKAIG